MHRAWIVLFAVVGTACGGGNYEVECEVSANCNLQPTGGSCDVNPETGRKWCSYLDSTCASGRRWSDFETGDGLSGQCQMEREPDGGVVDAPAASVDASANTLLMSLSVSEGSLEPAFEPNVSDYRLDLPLRASSLTLIPTAANGGATITVNGTAVVSGTESAPIALSLGENSIEIIVTSENGSFRTYALVARRAAGILQRAYAKASNTDAGDVFGTSIALNGDTLAVGATDEDSGGTELDNGTQGAGAVYVFVRRVEVGYSRHILRHRTPAPATSSERASRSTVTRLRWVLAEKIAPPSV